MAALLLTLVLLLPSREINFNESPARIINCCSSIFTDQLYLLHHLCRSPKMGLDYEDAAPHLNWGE